MFPECGLDVAILVYNLFIILFDLKILWASFFPKRKIKYCFFFCFFLNLQQEFEGKEMGKGVQNYWPVTKMCFYRTFKHSLH